MAIQNMLGTGSGATLIQTFTVGQAALAGAGSVTLISAPTNGRYRIVDININFGGTNFSGGGGDRNLSITDSGTVYSVVPAATLQALVNARWGSASLPLPASAAMDTLTGAGNDLVATYSGGASDYTAGSVDITLTYQFMGIFTP